MQVSRQESVTHEPARPLLPPFLHLRHRLPLSPHRQLQLPLSGPPGLHAPSLVVEEFRPEGGGEQNNNRPRDATSSLATATTIRMSSATDPTAIKTRARMQ